MNRSAFVSFASIVSVAVSAILLGTEFAQATIAPRNGGPLPAAMLARMAKDPTAYQFQHAWFGPVERARRARRALARGASPSAVGATGVSGTIAVPVLAGYFSGETVPDTIANWQSQLFGANPTGNVTDFWHEASYGALTMTGTVYGWTQVSQPESYYAGSNNGTDPTTDRVGEYIRELLDANDAAVDFSQFDNDGPDGIPNSGDDDGFVDMIAFIQSHVGGECGANGHIWSHKWVYSAWNASGLAPYVTNDPAAGGGFIRINDYTIQPAWNCSGAPNVIDIGVFCHEFGHALGLPDLYDFNSGGEGIGHWGIMGSGNWNTPTSPANPCAWTRMQMGWVNPTDVDWNAVPKSIPAINTSPVVYRLGFTSDRFRRSSSCAIAGNYSLYCGLTASEGTARGWQTPGPGGGYGSSWDESVRHDFTISAPGGPVVVSFAYRADMESGFDVARAVIDVSGTETVLATYTGSMAGTDSLDLTPYVGALAPGDSFVVKFRVITSPSFADDDGQYDSNCGAFAVDNVHVTGGGIDDLSTFENYADGWYQDPADNPVGEYWLVANREPLGFDVNLHGPGLLIWHVDDAVMASAGQGTSGGESNRLVRGLVLDEADGLFDLNTLPGNRGENSDPWPGSLGKTTFDSTTVPASTSNNGQATRIAVTAIPPASPNMTVTMRAGDPAPVGTGARPAMIDNDQNAVVLTVNGDLMRHGTTFRLVYSGAAAPGPKTADIAPSLVRWIDPTRVDGTIDVYGRAGGTWNLVITAPDGQTATVANAVTLTTIVPTTLVSTSAVLDHGAVQLQYVLLDHEPGELIRLLRRDDSARQPRVLVADFRPTAGDVYQWRDQSVVAGHGYEYVLTVSSGGKDERVLNRTHVSVPATRVTLEQNVPNPFNPSTSIRFVLPARMRATLSVYDVAGRKVRVLRSGILAAGVHDVPWNGRDGAGHGVGSGVYYYRLQAGTHAITRKMLLIK